MTMQNYVLKITKIHPDGTEEVDYFKKFSGALLILTDDIWDAAMFETFVYAQAMRARYLKVCGHRTDERCEVCVRKQSIAS